MASNKNYKIYLNKLEVVEVEAPPINKISHLSYLPNSPNPFGNTLKRGKFVNHDGKKWLLDEQLSDLHEQYPSYASEISQFKLQFSFETSLKLQEIDANRFLYSISRHIAQSGWRNGQRGLGAFFQLGQVEEGSIRGDMYAGIVAIGAFVANYPDLKNGFQEILTDAPFVVEQVATAIRAAKLPSQTDREHVSENDDQNEAYQVNGPTEFLGERPPQNPQRLLRSE